MSKFALPGALLLSGALLISGCATKKYVRTQVSPVDTRVAQVEKKTSEHSSSISDLENGVSRTDEKATEADKKAMAAAEAARNANDNATRAGKTADDARNMSQQNTAKIGSLEQSLEQSIQNIDNFKIVSDENVLFKFGSAELTKEATEKLDSLAQNMGTMRRYVVEVQGYTDKVGNKQYNLALSQRRADAVIRYLTVKHSIPLRSIHVIGLGSENMVTAANRREANKQSRRVELKLYAPEVNGAGAMQSKNSNGQ